MGTENSNREGYVAHTAAELRTIRNGREIRYSARSSKRDQNPFPNLRSIPCGQSLAGTGALVFEGEVLEIAR